MLPPPLLRLPAGLLRRLVLALDGLHRRWTGVGALADGAPPPPAASEEREGRELHKLHPRPQRRPRPSPLHMGHCCPVHGCVFKERDCAVFVGRAEPYFAGNNSCQECLATP